jgi:hypothetical protein
MHIASDPKHLTMHMPNGFLNGMEWVIDQEEEGMTCVWKWCEHENCFNLHGQKKSYKSEKYALFLKV